MRRNFVLMVAVIIIAFVIILIAINSSSPKISYSNRVVCETATATYGGSIVYLSTGNSTTVTSGAFFAQGTEFQTIATNLTYTTTPGYSTSFSELGNCTFISSR
jgi:hypothetical protein